MTDSIEPRRNLLHRFNEMPWGMRVGTCLSIVFIVNWCAATFLQLTGHDIGAWNASFGTGDIEFGPAQIETVPVVLFLTAIPAAFLFEVAWSRTLVLAFWLLVSTMLLAGTIFEGQGFGGFIGMFITLSICVAITLWYFYDKDSVVLYYERISARRRG
jgi:hypothetical protein